MAEHLPEVFAAIGQAGLAALGIGAQYGVLMPFSRKQESVADVVVDVSNVAHGLADIWEEYGSGLIAFHGQSGDIMFQGCTTENTQKAFDELITALRSKADTL